MNPLLNPILDSDKPKDDNENELAYGIPKWALAPIIGGGVAVVTTAVAVGHYVNRKITQQRAVEKVKQLMYNREELITPRGEVKKENLGEKKDLEEMEYPIPEEPLTKTDIEWQTSDEFQTMSMWKGYVSVETTPRTIQEEKEIILEEVMIEGIETDKAVDNEINPDEIETGEYEI